MIIAVTGHRPNKLWGYDLFHPKYKELSLQMLDFLEENKATHCISGLALGVDTVFAQSSMRYRRLYPELNVMVECAIPCANHSSKWNKEAQALYNNLLVLADIVTYVSKETYQPWLMQKRNEYMVDKCDLLLAIWDGSKGGTGNCVNYAKKKGKKIHIINPKVT